MRPLLLLFVLLPPLSCSRGPFPGDPLDAARRIPSGEAPSLLMDSRLTSTQRARVAAVLAGRFREEALPWIGKALAAYPPEEWPDRHLAVRALRSAGRAARPLLLACLADRRDPALRAEAARALAAFTDDPEVRKALAEASREDPSREVRRAAAGALGLRGGGVRRGAPSRGGPHSRR